MPFTWEMQYIKKDMIQIIVGKHALQHLVAAKDEVFAILKIEKTLTVTALKSEFH